MATFDTTVQSGKRVQANDLNIYYETYGSGTPLLLLHGGTVNLSMWSPHIPALAKHFYVIALDSRGHGRTSNPSGTLSYRLLADDTAAFIRALGLERPFVYGYSDGGQIAFELGMHYPNLARAYVIGAAAHRWPKAYHEFVARFGMEQPGVVDLIRVEREHPDLVARLREQFDRFQGKDYWKTYLQQLSTLWLTPLNYTSAELQQISVPTLILVGDRDDSILPIEQAAELYRMLPNAELAILPGKNHVMPWTNAELFVQIIVDFLLRQ